MRCIAEGSGRRTTKDYIQFLHIALGSVNELKTQIVSVGSLGYLEEGEEDNLLYIIFVNGFCFGLCSLHGGVMVRG